MLVSVDVTPLLKKEKEDVVLDVEWDELFSSVPSISWPLFKYTGIMKPPSDLK